MTTGLERRDEGWSAVQAADVAIHLGYGEYIQLALDDLIAAGQPFSSDEVKERAKEIVQARYERYAKALADMGLQPKPPATPAPPAPNLIGSIIGTAARAGRITRTGNRRRSTHPSRNAAYNAEWKAAQ